MAVLLDQITIQGTTIHPHKKANYCLGHTLLLYLYYCCGLGFLKQCCKSPFHIRNNSAIGHANACHGSSHRSLCGWLRHIKVRIIHDPPLTIHKPSLHEHYRHRQSMTATSHESHTDTRMVLPHRQPRLCTKQILPGSFSTVHIAYLVILHEVPWRPTR